MTRRTLVVVETHCYSVLKSPRCIIKSDYSINDATDHTSAMDRDSIYIIDAHEALQSHAGLLAHHTSNTQVTRVITEMQFRRNRGSEVHLDLAGVFSNKI